MKTTIQMAFAAILAATASVFGATNYVDCALDDYTGHDGSSWEKAFKTIQQAVDASTAGDTVLVAPGVYDEGTKTDSKGSTNRVYLTKQLTIKGVAGAGSTHIVGRWDTRETVTTNGCGGLQIRCICVNGAGGSVIEGFTLRDGATRLDRTSSGGLNEDIPQLGGGLAVYSGKKDVYLVDCVISNCTACWGGAMRGGTAVRCLITRNRAYSSNPVSRVSNLYACLVTRNLDSTVSYGGAAVNCTFAENAGTPSSMAMYNSLVTKSVSGTFVNSVSEVYDTPFQMFAPMRGDYRLLKGAAAETAGSSSHFSGIFTVPEGCEGKDFFGNDFPVSEGTTVAGAIAESVEPQHGGISFDASVTCDGEYVPVRTYAFFNEWPIQVRIRPGVASGATFFRYEVSGANTTYNAKSRWLDLDGNLDIVPPYSAGLVMTNTAHNANARLWVDANYAGGDSDGTIEKPYTTIQDAVDTVVGNASHKTIIYVAEGDYNKGGYYDNYISNRVYIADGKHILLKATGRVEKTIIRGAADTSESQQHPEWYPGCGPAGVRCVKMSSVNSQSAIQGFTIADGHSNCNNYLKDDAHDRCGGILGPSTVSYALGQALDCVFTNCAAVRGGVFYGIWASRCKFYDCRAYGGVTRYSVLSACYVDRSNTIGDVKPTDATANKVVGTQTAACHTTADSDSTTSNRGFETLYQIANVADSWSFAAIPNYGTVARRSSWTSPNSIGHTIANPMFVDMPNKDFRLLSTSGAIGGGNFSDDGSASYVNAMNFYATFATSDMDGERIRFTDGVPTAGAWQTPVAALAVGASGGGLSVNGNTGAATNVMPATVTVELDESGTRPITGFTVNGVEYSFTNGTSYTFSAADYGVEDTFSIVPLLTTDWYVNAVTGDDGNTGFMPSRPKLTLAAAMAQVASGDTVHAAPGTYDRGDIVAEYGSDPAFIKSRVEIPAGVTLVADEGPDVTFIKGADATIDPDEYGCGTNAVRCVAMRSKSKMKTLLSGFTLTGGRTHYRVDRTLASVAWNANYTGGGVICGMSLDSATNSIVHNCVISNCVAVRGAATRSLTLVNCRIFDCIAEQGTIGTEILMYGCVADRLQGSSAVEDYRGLRNCTFGRDVMDSVGNRMHVTASQYGINFGCDNCLFLGSVRGITNAFNSIFGVGSERLDLSSPDLGGSVVASSVDAYPVDSGYAPVIGANAAVDAWREPSYDGPRAIWRGLEALAGDVDAYGRQRVSNATQDIGAVEADWRPRYSTDIARSRRFTVVYASPGVVETGSGTVMLSAGDSLDAEWMDPKAKLRRYSISVLLSQDAELEVAVNGERKVFTTEGAGLLEFRSAEPLNTMSFACKGGTAQILSSLCESGMAISLR